MKIFWWIFTIVVISGIWGFGFLFREILKASIPTKGPIISKYPTPRQALFVIDVQEDYTGERYAGKRNYPKRVAVINKINQLIEQAQQNDWEIIYIKQEFASFSGKLISKMFMGGTALSGEPGTEIDARIKIVNDQIFTKQIGDAFSNKELDSYLRRKWVNEVYLVGLDAEYCVHSTARGALNRGYIVKIIKDAVLIGNQNKWNSLLNIYQNEGIKLVDKLN